MSTALSMKQAIELSETWHSLQHNAIFVVTNGREFLVEPPEERQDREEDADEAVLRIFTEHEDAWLYCESQQEFYGEESARMHVLGFGLTELFELKDSIFNNALIDFGVDVRLDVCTLRNGEPVVVDTLWAPRQRTH